MLVMMESEGDITYRMFSCLLTLLQQRTPSVMCHNAEGGIIRHAGPFTQRPESLCVAQLLTSCECNILHRNSRAC